MREDRPPTPAGVVIVPLEPMQAAELAPILREGYLTGRPLFGEIRRTTSGVYLFAAMVDKQTARKIQRLLNPPATDKGPAPAPGEPPA